MSCSIGIGLIAWIVLLTITGVTGLITNPPMNAVADVGSQAMFNCTSDLTSQNWNFSRTREEFEPVQTIAFNCTLQSEFTTHYEVDRSGGSNYTCNLIVKAMTMQQAGIYTCGDISNGLSAVLTVIDRDASITVNSTEGIVEGDMVEMSYTVRYTPIFSQLTPTSIPDPIWTDSDGNRVTSELTLGDISVTSWILVRAERPDIPPYSCRIRYQFGRAWDGLQFRGAKNTPVSVHDPLYSSTIKVLYPVENISIHSTVPTTEYKCVAKTEALTCSANVNPPAEYVWLDLQNNITTTGANISISSGGQYTCTAFNIIRNQTYNATKTATEISCYISDHVRPSNAVAKFGGGAILNCSDPSVYPDWIMSKDDTATNRLTIAVGCSVSEKLQGHYDVDKVGGPHVCSLIVSKATMDQGGVYWCNGSSDPYKALLTVLDSSPTITYNNAPVEGLDVVITCALNHYGSVEPSPTLRPHFYWTDYTGDNASNVYNPPPSNNSVVSQLTVTAGREDIMPYTCHVYMQLMPPVTVSYATNTPSVNSSASSPTITVLYPVGKTTITSTTENCVRKPETLTCTADANPPAQYVWLDLINNITTTGANKSISSGGQYQCIASNSIWNQTYNEQKTVTETNCPGLSPSFQKAGSSSLVWRKFNYLQLSLVCSLMNYIRR